MTGVHSLGIQFTGHWALSVLNGVHYMLIVLFVVWQFIYILFSLILVRLPVAGVALLIII